MFTPIARIALVLLSLVMAIYLYLEGYYLNVVLALIGAALFIYGYFKYGTVYAAFQQLKKNNFNKAEDLIGKIKNPKILSKQQKGYYHFVKGIIATENKDWDIGHTELSEALEFGLRTKNDTSIVMLNLASIEYERKQFNKALDILHNLEGIELKPLVKSEIEKLHNKIAIEQNSNETKFK